MCLELNNVFKKRLNLGFKRAIIPASNLGGWDYPTGIQIIGVETVNEAMKEAFS